MRKPTTLRRRLLRAVPGVVMTAPALLTYVAMILVPLGLLVYLSMTDWNGYNTTLEFLGGENYGDLLESPRATSAAYFTLLIAVFGTLGCNAFGLLFAVLLLRPTKVNAFFRTIFFFPHVISPLIIGFLWSALLAGTGVLNNLFGQAGVDPLPFLADPGSARAWVIVVTIWATFGVNMILYLAGLSSVPKEFYEAAELDGAGPWLQFRHVTLPMIAPVVTVNLVVTLVWMLKAYDLVLSMTAGGPAGQTQTAIFLIIFDSFQNGKLGLGAAQAAIFMIITACLGLTVALLRRRADKKVSA